MRFAQFGKVQVELTLDFQRGGRGINNTDACNREVACGSHVVEADRNECAGQGFGEQRGEGVDERNIRTVRARVATLYVRTYK